MVQRLTKLLIVLTLCSSVALAAETAKVNTEDAATVAKGDTEIEFTFSYQNADGSFDSGSNIIDRAFNFSNQANLKFTHGVRDDLDLAIQFTAAHLRDKSTSDQDRTSFGDTQIFAKWTLFNHEDRHLISFVPSVIIPIGEVSTGDEAPAAGQDYWSFGFMGVYTYNLEQFNLSNDIYYFLPVGEDRGSDRGTFGFDVAIGYQIFDWLQPEIEFNYARNFQSNQPFAHAHGVTVGAVLNLTDSIRLDLGFQSIIAGKNSERVKTGSANLSWTI